ncbi:MAG: gluconate 2-dehydrogenase subunit 3 family protein [Myxococcota bacterium]|nr:gluconate 2-dehydrogenase subunit 3 family protein [Myxococcota bacterium]
MASSLPNELSSERLQLLAGVLDAIIPPGEGDDLPGAGELGLGEALQRKAPELVPLVAEGLGALEREMANRQVADFGGLAESDKRSLLEDLGSEQPGFLPALLFQVYTTYYQHPRVLAALGLEARPPYPLGYELEGGDLGLLDPVRKRPPLYRRT